jgi:hypothetical protein
MAKWIKNNTAGDKTWVGQLVSASAYYEIQSTEELLWMNDSILITDIGSGDAIVAKDDSGNEDITDVNDAINYLKDIKTNIEIDDEGRQVHRPAYGKKGWTYLAHPVEFETSKDGSVYSSDWQDQDRGDYTLKFYKANGTEIVDAGEYADKQAHLDAECVETRITVSPNYDYEVISGKVDIHTRPTTNVRMWVIGGIIDTTNTKPWEYPASSGVFHVKEFAGGVNFKFVESNQEFETDGRASKFMCKTKTGVPYNANQFQIIMRHDAGVKQEFMLTLEYFRA